MSTRRWVAIAMTPAALAALWVLLGGALSGYKERLAEQAWAASAEPTTDLLARYPKSATNEMVRSLDALCRRLGIVMLPEAGAPRPKGAQDELLAKVAGFVGDRQKKGSDDRLAPPDDVAAFLGAHADDAEAVEAFLESGPDLVWEQDLALATEAPIVPLMGPRQLVGVLLARSLEADRQGDAAAARRALAGAATVTSAVQRRVELVSQLVAISMVSQRDGVLRGLRGPPAEWEDRLGREDFRAPLLRALQLEAWNFGQMGVNLRTSVREKGYWGIVRDPFVSPWIRLSAADFSQRIHDAAIELRDGGDACSSDPSVFDQAKLDAMPRWNILGRIAIPNIARTWGAGVQAAYDVELTRHVLAARRGRGEASETPPRTLGPSAACPGVKWQQVARADGSVSIYPDRDPFPRQKPFGTVSYVLRGEGSASVSRPAASP